MDVLDMSEFKTGEFNVVVDKGTLDSILCGDNSEPNALKMLAEIYRVLSPSGTYICVTYGDEERRRKYLVRIVII
jgi:ubiquinone/menaquinone biosynthesis C-methylase UbiE